MNRERRRKATRGRSSQRAAPSKPSQFSGAEALSLGVTLFEAGRTEDAKKVFVHLLKTDSQNAEALNMLGFVEHLAGESRKACSYFERAIAAQPRSAKLHNNLAEALNARGDHEAAMEQFQAALNLEADYGPAHNGLGLTLHALGMDEAAAASFAKAIALSPELSAAHYNLAITLLRLGRREEAVASLQIAYDQGVSAARDLYAHSVQTLAWQLERSGRAFEAEAWYREAIARGVDTPKMYSSFLLCLNYNLHDPGDVFEAHRLWQARHATGITPLSPLPDAGAARRRLRIGYMTPDLDAHSVGYFLRPILEHRNRDAYEVSCYIDIWKPDGRADWIEDLADHYLDTTRMTDEALANRIAGDGIDILVDLTGHTPHDRLLTLVRRPAPVLVNYLGYVNTTGLDAVDYRITDAVAEPPGDADRFSSEELVRLPGGLFCYRPREDAPPPAGPPCLESASITFGSMCDPVKVGPAVIALWARVLAAVPASRLLVKMRPLDEPEARERLLSAFAAEGIGAERLLLEGSSPDIPAHLRTYHRIDIALDAFPHGGATTSCEATWMGVPIVTLAGRTYAGRTGTTILHRVGLDELVAVDEDRYVAIAAGLASDPERIAALRETLRATMAASPLCDGERVAAEIEAAYQGMWARAVAGLPATETAA